VALLLVLPHLAAWTDSDPARHAPHLAAPRLAGWEPSALAFPDWSPAFENPAATLHQAYSAGDRQVGLYIGYYRGQGPTRKLVSADNALVKPQDTTWTQAGSGTRSVELDGRRVVVRTATLHPAPLISSSKPSIVVWQIYWVNGTLTASDARAKVYGAVHRLLGRGDDAAVIVAYASEDTPGGAQAALEAFMQANIAALKAQLHRTREGRERALQEAANG
jgi:EpsI family protein